MPRICTRRRTLEETHKASTAATASPASPPGTIVPTAAAEGGAWLEVGVPEVLVSDLVADGEWDPLWDADADDAAEEADSDAAEEMLEADSDAAEEMLEADADAAEDALDTAEDAEDRMEEMTEPMAEVADAIGSVVAVDEEMTRVMLPVGTAGVQEGWPDEPGGCC